MKLLFLILCTFILIFGKAGGACLETTKRDTNNEDYYTELIRSIYQSSNSYFNYQSIDPDLYLEEWTIKDASEPLRYHNKELFWDFESVRNMSKICQYNISDRDFDLRNTYFLNGSQPEYLFYGCSYLDACKGLQCTASMCKKVLIFFASSTVAAILLCQFYTRYMERRRVLEEERKYRNQVVYRDLADVQLVRRVTSNGITVVTWQREEE